MKRPYKLILASLLCAAPLGALLPGCGGGGGGSSTGPFRLETRLGIRFDETSLGNLTVQLEDTASSTKKIVGTFQVLNRTTGTATPTATTVATAVPGTTPTATAVPNRVDFYPAPASYIIRGTVTTNSLSQPVLDATGSFQGGPTFTLRGILDTGQKIRLEAAFREGTRVTEGTLLAEQVTGGGGGATATPIATRTATPIGTATPVGTTTPGTTATPIATTTATPFLTATPLATATVTPTPSVTAIP
jgi:hypothetical protein